MSKSLEEISRSRRLLQNPYAHLDGNGTYSALHQSGTLTTKSLSKQIKESRRLLEDPYAYLDSSGDFSALPSRAQHKSVRKRGRHSNADIEQKAQELQRLIWAKRKQIWGDSIPADPVDMLDPSIALELLGYDFTLEETLGHYHENGRLVEVAGLIDNYTKRVRISRQFSDSVRAFTAAHELGHAVLHEARGLHRDRPLDGTKLSRDIAELEADKFATNYLMPRKLVRDRFVSHFGTACFIFDEDTVFELVQKSLAEFSSKYKTLRDLSRLLAGAEYFNGCRFISLATQFRVSVEAMAIRLEELELLVV